MVGQVLLVFTFFPTIMCLCKKKRQKTKACIYKNLGKNLTEAGSGRRHVAQKHGWEIRNGVFQVGSGSGKQCFAMALLVGKSFLQKDKHFSTLDKNRNIDLTKLYTTDKITNVYTTTGLPVGAVRVDQLHILR